MDCGLHCDLLLSCPYRNKDLIAPAADNFSSTQPPVIILLLRLSQLK